MSIKQLKKITLIGRIADKSDILEGLQQLGCMHLLPLRNISESSVDEQLNKALPRAEDAYSALRFLTRVHQRRRQVVNDKNFDVNKVVTKSLELKQQLRDIQDYIDFLRHRCAAIEPWGDIVFPPHNELAGLRLWFYTVPLRKMASLDSVTIPWQIVRKDHSVAYVLLIAEHEPPDNILPVGRTHVGALSLSELRIKLEEAEIKLEEYIAQRQAMTRYIYLLTLHLTEADNLASLNYAAQQTLDDEAIVAVQGWVSITDLQQVETYAHNTQLVCVSENPTADDNPPTLIEQPKEMQAGVDLALFYQVPGYRTWDPTLLLLGSFSLFFAMIVADAGYGLILLLGLLAFWRKLGKSPKLSSYRVLGLCLFSSTLIYGVIVGSYFGFKPPPDSLFEQLQILSVHDFDTMMKLSIVIGVIHISIANLMIAYIHRDRLYALSKLGWVLIMSGCLLIWLFSFDEKNNWRSVGLFLISVGTISIILFASKRIINKKSDYFWRVLEGIFSLRGLMNAFGDVLSYMRLFALGLASASLAMTFNNLAKDVIEDLPGLGLLLAIVIISFGHLLNLGLALMSGVVHGLRLNFIEFYNWGLPEEGSVFQKFSKKEVKL